MLIVGDLSYFIETIMEVITPPDPDIPLECRDPSGDYRGQARLILADLIQQVLDDDFDFDDEPEDDFECMLDFLIDEIINFLPDKVYGKLYEVELFEDRFIKLREIKL